MKSKIRLNLAITLFGACIVANPSHAVAVNVFTLLGSVEGTTTGTVQDGDQIEIRGRADRSYECTIIANGLAALDSQLAFSGVTDPNSAPLASHQCGNISPAIDVHGGTTVASAGRLCFTGNITGPYLVGITAKSGGEDAKMFCRETTMFGGFNTFSSDFNFLEIKNITGATVSGTITAIAFDGTVKINKAGFVVQPFMRTDIDIHTPAGRNVYGTLILTHDGPFGALDADLSEYVITTPVPLVFRKVAGNTLKPRP